MFLPKADILKEYKRLDALCGVDTSHIECSTYRAKENTVAYCQFITHTAIPAKILFNRHYLDWMPKTDCIDVVRHEYAHAAAALLYGPASLEGTGHGRYWKKVCEIVGCRPYPYTYNLNVAEPLLRRVSTGAGMCQVECCRCGTVLEQPKDSRIITVLKAGLTSWNFTCPACGGFRFRLIESTEEADVS